MSAGDIYEFVYRGQLADVALDAAGRPKRYGLDESVEQIANALSLEMLESEHLDPAQKMSVVYAAIAAFENSVRRFVTKVLIDSQGDDWWTSCVSESTRKKAEGRQAKEERTRYHGQRGTDPLDYTDLGELARIIQNNWQEFEPYVPRQEWAVALFDGIEMSRNVIMHSGQLALQDVERLGTNMRDWIRQVGL